MSSLKLGFAYKYVRGSKQWLTLLLLHGTGGDESDMLSTGEYLAPDASLLSPRGKVLENGMSRYFRRFCDGSFDHGDLKFRSCELTEFVKTAAKEYDFDPRRTVAVGYSSGATVAATMLLHNPYALHALVLFRPTVPFTPIYPPKLHGKPVYISAGTNDEVVPHDGPEQLEKLLNKAGANVTLNWTEAGHTLIPKDLELARAWFIENIS